MTSWRAPGEMIRTRTWASETVAYHAGSGETLLLNPLAAEVLQRLLSEPVAEAELARSAAEAFGVEPDAEWHEAVAGCLRRLARARMVLADS